MRVMLLESRVIGFYCCCYCCYYPCYLDFVLVEMVLEDVVVCIRLHFEFDFA